MVSYCGYFNGSRNVYSIPLLFLGGYKMKKISNATFLRAIDSPLATVQGTQYGNSLFGDFTMLVQVNSLYFVRESRTYYKAFETEIEENHYQFDNASEALAYFADAESMASEYTEEHGTVAGGF